MKKRLLNFVVVCTSIFMSCVLSTSAAAVPATATMIDSGLTTAEVLTIEDVPAPMLEELQSNLAESGNKAVALDSVDSEALTTLTTINEDGSKTLCDYGYPIKYRDKKSGQIKFIDNEVKKTGFWKGLFSGTGYESTDNEVQTLFPKKINNGIQLQMIDHTIKIYPDVETNANAVIVEDDTDTSESTVEYRDAFGKGAHLQYVPICTGLKENIILEEWGGINVYRFRLEVGGLIPQNTEGTWIRFVDPATGEEAFTIGESYAQDSYVGEYREGQKHVTYDNSYTLTKEKDGVYVLSMEIDKAFLETPDTVYPVTIDPTYSNSRFVDGFYDATVGASPLYDNDFSGQYYTVSAGNSMAYIKNYGVEKYKHINPDNITKVNYNVTTAPQDTPSCTFSVDIPWNVHNIHTVTYNTLYVTV